MDHSQSSTVQIPSSAYAQVEQLVKKFQALSTRERNSYNEAATRQDFILPLFRALEWDIHDSREVAPEEKISRGFVDFSFRLNGVRRFVLETKRIHENLNDPRWAKQAVEYAYYKGVTWAVLSDFEGLKIFNAEVKEQNPFQAIFKEFSLDEYLTRFAELWWLSRPAIAEGILDREAEKVFKKSIRTPITQSLFENLKDWREELYKNLRAYNKGKLYTPKMIDDAVQRILDRLIFIRTAEDRDVEGEKLIALMREKKPSDLIPALNQRFRELDRIYNSQLFAPHYSEDLDYEPATIKTIIEGLYGNPANYVSYNFALIDADVLGKAYEQYLGYVFSEQDEITAKKTKRKSQGIYYTPTFVVKYIVQQTLGRYVEERGYNAARTVRVLDPACGSGSFLIEAFDVLDHFMAREQNQERGEYEFHDYARQMQILTENIYGVDKDEQAVEVAQLNLLLKALHLRDKLPVLRNIRQGDSLISGTDEELREYFGEDWREKHAFNWDKEFQKVMADGGFDVIIGNPPYGAAFTEDEKRYLKAKYTYTSGKPDSYLFFIERCVTLLRDTGMLGLIVPNAWLTNYYGKQIREYLLSTCEILGVVNLEPVEVFAEAVVDTSILIARKQNQLERRATNEVEISEGLPEGGIAFKHEVSQSGWMQDKESLFNIMAGSAEFSVFQHLETESLSLNEVCEYSQGIIPYKTKDESRGDPYISDTQKSKAWKPLLESADCVSRYSLSWHGKFIYYGNWLWCARDSKYFESPKLLFHRIRKKLPLQLVATFDDQHFYNRHSLSNLILRHETQYGLKYILGLFNSRLLNYWFVHRFGLLMEVGGFKVGQIPIHRINFDDPADKQRHDHIVAMVEEMLRLQKEYQDADMLREDRRLRLKDQIDELDREIDKAVYELYGLTEDEIRVVEAK